MINARKWAMLGASALGLAVAYTVFGEHAALAGSLLSVCPASPPGAVKPDPKDDVPVSAADLKALQDALAQRDTDLKAAIEKANAELAASKTMSDETRNQLLEITASSQKLQARLLDLEQKLGRRGNLDAGGPKDYGKLFAENDGFKAMAAGQRGSARITLSRGELMGADLFANITSAGGSAGTLIVADRQPGIIMPQQRPMTIRDLVLPGRTTSNAIEYVRESGFTNNAAMVAEGATKPQSELTFEMISRSVRTIAHWVKASKQILDDVPQLLSYVSGRLRYGLAYKEESQLLLGDNTGQNLDGLMPNATDYDTGRTRAGDTKIDVIRHAITQVRVAEYQATGVVVNPNDWDEIETEKDDNGRYIWASVTLGGEQRLWRVPVIDTNAMPEGQFMVGAFKPAAQIFDREDANVSVSNEDGNNFITNMVTILVEERLVQAIYRGESFVAGDYSAVSGG